MSLKALSVAAAPSAKPSADSGTQRQRLLAHGSLFRCYRTYRLHESLISLLEEALGTETAEESGQVQKAYIALTGPLMDKNNEKKVKARLCAMETLSRSCPRERFMMADS